MIGIRSAVEEVAKLYNVVPRPEPVSPLAVSITRITSPRTVINRPTDAMIREMDEEPLTVRSHMDEKRLGVMSSSSFRC